MRGSSLLVLLCATPALGLVASWPSTRAPTTSRRALSPLCEEGLSLTPEDEAALKRMGISSLEELESLPGPGEGPSTGATDASAADGSQCEGRVVTELVDAENKALPERFTLAMRAIGGEFSPVEGDSDTERDDGNLLAGLIQFPADLPLRVVSVPGADVDGLVADVTELASGDEPPQVVLRLGGRVASISCTVRCENPGALRAARDTLLADPRVKMVF